MTIDIAIVFLILGLALFLFFSGWVRMDIVALMVLGSLSVTGLVSPAQALAGFSNPAVITVGAMFILSAALYQTGVARILGRQVLRFSGKSEASLIVTIMLTSGFLSAFMNNIGVAALMLPVVMDIARSTQRSPSRLLMPLAYGCLLGGLTTLIGTPPNLLISYAMTDHGLEGFRLFDFTPVGLGAMMGGILFIALIGRYILPTEGTILDAHKNDQMLSASYALQERTFMIRIKPGSELQGKTLAESRLRAALGINVLSIKREGGGIILDPGPDTLMRSNDKLFVQGRQEVLKSLHGWKILLPMQSGIDPRKFLDDNLNIYEAWLSPDSPLSGINISEEELRKKLGINILGINQNGNIILSQFKSISFSPDDKLLLQGPEELIKMLEEQGAVTQIRKVTTIELADLYNLHEALFIMEISQDSELFDKSSPDTQLGAAFGLSVLGILRDDLKTTIPVPGETFKAGDRLLVQGNKEDLPLLRGLMNIELLDEKAPGTQSIEEGDIQMAEVVLAPRSLLAGKTLRDINFRKKYGLTVLAIWREGRAYRTNLHNLPLRFGEALLIYGKRDKMELISSESDFIMLTDTRTKPMRTDKALTSVIVMLGVLVPVLMGFIPLAIASLIGVSVMVLTGCLKMEEAYRAIEWRSVFLIAGLLPLGAAMQETGAASLMAQGVVELFGRFGPWGIITGLYLLTSLSTLAIPPAALVVVMSPVALQAAENFDVSPYSVMMTIAMAAASSFLSPVSHPANLLVMGPAGYKFSDYLKLGLPLALVVMIIVLVILPIFWPLSG
jgi:di/tricarboxylate transporter